MLKKNTSLKLIEYYNYINHNSIYDNKAINRYKKDNYEISQNKSKNLELLKKAIFNIKNCSLKKQAKNIVFCDINCDSSNLKNILSKKNPVCILIGPEGDFSEKERQLISDNKKTISISLAKNILRAETAAVAATTILSYNLNFR